jgi:hypothetical protein
VTKANGEQQGATTNSLHKTNDLIFNNIVASTPDVGVRRMISFMQKWSVLHKEKAQLWIDLVICKLRHQLSSLNSED